MRPAASCSARQKMRTQESPTASTLWLSPYFILYTGVRKGEASAIQGGDIDHKNSYASMILDAGLDLKDRQDLLGHATAAMTQDTYTHIRDSHRVKTAAALNAKLDAE